MEEMRRMEDITNHYYSEYLDTTYDSEQWAFELKGRTFQFITGSGVFSHETVDHGLCILIDVFDWEELPDEGKILDVGCGYRPIELALTFATQRLVEMVDISEWVVSLAQGNAKHNQIEQMDIHQSNTCKILHEETYVAIVNSPPIRTRKKIVHEILTGVYPRLKQGGILTIVIQKKQRAPDAQKKMGETSGNAEIVTRDKRCYITRSVKE